MSGNIKDSSGTTRITLHDNGDLHLRDDDGNRRLTVDTSGNIGISNLTPDYRLDVHGDIGLNDTLHHNGDEDTYILFDTNIITLSCGASQTLTAYAVPSTYYQNYVVINESGDDTDFRVESKDDTAALFISGYYNRIGLGTTAPKNRLDVEGSMAVGNSYSGSNTAPSNGLIVQGKVGIGTNNPTKELEVNGTTRTDILDIVGGSDLAEPFAMSDEERIVPGTVVAIDPRNPGKLRISDQAYDKRVAGVVSGAGGLSPGLTLSQKRIFEAGQNVALTGRVYCWADANYGSIEPGDRLTTSDTPGHAMKAQDNSRAAGAVIGKAMTPLTEGRGLVLVLVQPQ
jgi:hypothetical protein